MSWIYLDNNATTQPLPEVLAAAHEIEETLWANPSSVHRFGQAVRQRVELARASVASLIGCRDRELVFTSGGTESNNLALRGLLGPALAPPAGKEGEPATTSPPPPPARPRRVLITTALEHSAIREPGEFLRRSGVEVVRLPVDLAGLVQPGDLARALAEHAKEDATVLVSLQWANNETGVVEPIAALVDVVRAHRQANPKARVLFHTDATQAVGKIPVDVKTAGVDLLTLSGHKLHGPKGVGALFIRTGVRLEPQNLGGPQERDRRGGTENAPAIVGLGVAAERAVAFLADVNAIDRLLRLRERFERGVIAVLRPLMPDATIHSDVIHSDAVPPTISPAPRLWNTANLGFPRLEAEAILLGLSERGLCASAGAACSSGSLEPSPVLLAMGIPPAIAHGSVRFSLSRLTTEAEIDRALEIVPAVVARLARTLPAQDAPASTTRI
ncbi:MAG: cysteine desulfurase family protein [Planctomycetota bacterium]|nr:cysteine desulfurase family protein [Planctomycetota bacterium]